MKSVLFLSLIALMSLTACKKDSSSGSGSTINDAPRSIRFTLYSDKDLSTDNEDVLFNVFIQTSSGQPIWDSALAPMKVKNIPDLANKIVVDKTITGYANSLLKVGFRYSLPGVGDSWHYDAASPGETFSEVIFNFQ